MLLAFLATGCEEETTILVTDIGTVGLVLANPGLSSQVVTAGVPEETIQVIEWRLAPPGDLTRQSGGASQDLLFEEPCLFVQTTTLGGSYNPQGRCASGIVLGSSDDFGAIDPPTDVPVTLGLKVIWMQVRRAKPLVLPVGEDYDADGVQNEIDNCPLIPNPDQTDANEDGVGGACSTRDIAGAVVADNDGDGVADSSDNCVWIQNPGQEDTTGAAAEYGIPDGIGDACEEEKISNIQMVPVDLDKEFTLALATGGLTFVTVDFDTDVTLSCDWLTGTCVLKPEEVDACGVPNSLTLALDGCSEGE